MNQQNPQDISKNRFRVSSLMDFCETPYHFYWFHILGHQRKTRTMDEGRMLHSLVFQPDDFYKTHLCNNRKAHKYNILKTVDDYKEFIFQFTEKKPIGKKDDLKSIAEILIEKKGLENILFHEDLEDHGIHYITDDMWDKLHFMADSVRSKSFFKRFPIESGISEQRFEMDIDGFTLTGQIDWFIERENRIYVLDLKKSKSAKKRKFMYSIEDYKYHIQAACYHDIIKSNFNKEVLFGWPVVEATPPYICEIYSADIGTIDAGQQLYKGIIKDLKNCMKTNIWPTYTNGAINNISLPDRGFDEISDYLERIDAMPDSSGSKDIG